MIFIILSIALFGIILIVALFCCIISGFNSGIKEIENKYNRKV